MYLGKVSEDLHHLVQILGENHLKSEGLGRGREGSKDELSKIIGQIRRKISCTEIQAQGLCLLDRLGNLGDGAKKAAERRGWVKREEERMRLKRRAHWVGNIRGRGVVW